MENVILVIHLILSLCLIGIVLLQRSEGGGLGMGSGGGSGGGLVSARAAATGLGRVTWIIAAAFFCTSIALTVIAARNADDSSVLDRVGGTVPSVETPVVPSAEELLPPSTGDAPATPPRAD